MHITFISINFYTENKYSTQAARVMEITIEITLVEIYIQWILIVAHSQF